MNETGNPFEDALRAKGTEGDPFAQTVDPFGSEPATAISAPSETPKLNLGSIEATENPFETPAVSSAGAPNAAPPVKPDLGSQPGAVIPFSTAQTKTAGAESNGGQLGIFGAEADNGEKHASKLDTSKNPIEAAMTEHDKAGYESVFAKPPVFEHGAVKEPIEDLNQTFEDLRVAKSDDFPELEDAIRVSWDITYGKIRKTVPTPKKTKIGEFKKQIETSKEFLDALKKEKDKSPSCIIKPRITAQSKGKRDASPNFRCGGDEGRFPSYKGVFTSLEESAASGKVISIVPGRDGKVYEIRREEAGTFIAPSRECKELSEIEAGFTPALPPIPHYELRRIIGFFRSLMNDGHNYEAIANIYWDRDQSEYRVIIPRQHVTSIRADSDLSDQDDYEPERFLHYMDVHSHNVMPAKFSARDDRDEKATRLYAVIGKLHEFIPEMSVRISNGGKYLLIDPATVFESFGDYYPAEWNDQVSFGTNDEVIEPSGIGQKWVHSLLKDLGWKGRMCV